MRRLAADLPYVGRKGLNPMSNPASRTFVRLSVVVTVLAGFSFFGAHAQAQVTFRPFVDPHAVVSGGTIGFTFAGDKFVGSVQNDGMGVLYQTDLQGQSVTTFAPNVTIPAGSSFSEHPIAASLGLGRFPRWDIYVGGGNSILHISHDGDKSEVFAKNLPGAVQAIRFDTVGTFKFEMLVTTLSGFICHINSAGQSACPINFAESVEGMDIAPLGGGFGAFDGYLITVAESFGLVRAISPSWQLTVLNPQNPIPSPESINFVPLNLGSSGSAVEGFYESNYPNNVVKADAAQFSQFKGDAIIATEYYPPTFWRMHWTQAGFDITSIGKTPIQSEDAIFVTPSMLNPQPCTVKTDHGRDSETAWCAPYCLKKDFRDQ